MTHIPRNSEQNSHTYLLKVWREGEQETASSASWRFSLEDAASGARRGFTNLDSLLIYLQDLTTPHSIKTEIISKRGKEHAKE